MTQGFVLNGFVDNVIIWAILALALFCFIVEFSLLLSSRDPLWKERVRGWLKVMPVLLSALPLLGLLGTIAGLMETFRSMALSSGLDQQGLLSSGIADALITTQLGLIMVIPGIMLFTFIRYRYREQAEERAAP